MSDLAITGVGAYAPRLRIDADAFAEAWGRFEASGVERKAVAEADEDTLTMAAAAAGRALDAAGIDGDELAGLSLATTTPPLAEEELVVRLGSMLGAPGTATHHQFTASTRAGMRALAAALDAERSPMLVVAADCPRAEPPDEREHAAGAGAAAFVLTPGEGARVVAHGEYTTPRPGERFRESGDDRVQGLGVTSYDRAVFHDALAGAAADAGIDEPDVSAAAVQAPDGKRPYRATGPLGVDSEAIQTCATVQDLGDTGAASVPLSLARALADDHDRVLAAAYGSGAGADVFLVETETPVAAELAIEGDLDLSYPEYLRRRGDLDGQDPEGGGAYVPVPTWKRSLAQRHRLVAGRCPECGALAFPPEGACTDCGALVQYDAVTLPGHGTVEAVTRIGRGGAPPEFATQQVRSGAFGVVVVAFDGPDGGVVSAPAQVTDHDPEADGELAVGDRVEAVVRRVYTQENVTRYGFKVRPADD
ncbi:zinc ribbon domain-containing protein [Haloglomus litoreum]|uniref:zinc ribbon domain-containing protein n=1 Tax=Haloglomus litoreum TaxID=3034026 RepID=UPI0023E8D491|nr:zinc ribbon domain-containing protein [Haloglomus sp. DT116]